MREHEAEPVYGLPERPPAGETILWQGSPQWRVLARQVFHIRIVAAYLAALWLWLACATIAGHETPLPALAIKLGTNLALGLTALGLMALYCYLTQRTTIYTVTDRRVVIRFGIAMPLTVNLPFASMDGADVRTDRDGCGAIALSLLPARRVSYLILWPHARPWRFTRPGPMLRGLADAVRPAQTLSRALAASAEQSAPAIAVPAGAAAAAGPATAAA